MQDRAAQRGVDLDWATTGDTTTDASAVRAAAEMALSRGVRAFIVHAVGDVHEILLETIAAHGLTVGEDVSVISAAASFDTSSLAVPVDTIPLVPQKSCELAVDLAVRHLEEPGTPAQIHLIPPEYHVAGSVAPARE